MTKRLLIVAHAPSDNTRALRDAVEWGARSETGVDVRVVAATNRDEAYQNDIVDGLTQGLQGQQGLTLPVAWDAFSNKVHASNNPDLVAKVKSLDVVLGSSSALTEARKVALDASATPEARKAALQSLLDARAADLRQVAQQMLNVKSANAVAATALAAVTPGQIRTRAPRLGHACAE